MAKNPHYLSQLAHVELLSTNKEETVRFYTDIVGLDKTGEDENSVYLRAWGDYFLYTLKITQSNKKAWDKLDGVPIVPKHWMIV
ncbi:MAG: hypothetical protein ACXWWC_10205 [Chitinophagaceae bacterium]